MKRDAILKEIKDLMSKINLQRGKLNYRVNFIFLLLPLVFDALTLLVGRQQEHPAWKN